MKKKMNPKTKRAVVVLSIIALIIFIIGLVSCSIQLSQKNPSLPAVTDSGNPVPTPDDKIVIPKIDQGNPGNLIDDAPPEEIENGGKDMEQGKAKPSPAKPTEKPPVSPKPVKPADPTMPPVTPTPKPSEPVKPTKPTEPPKQEEKPSTPDKPGGGGSGGGSTSYPAGAVSIDRCR